MDEDYLVHYGVLGMKWGVRKARKKGTSYSYTSMRTKHLEKKSAKAKSKGKKNAGKIAERLKYSKQTDKNLLAYAKKTSVGKALAQDILLGPGGAKSYQTMRANGVSRDKALTYQVLSKAAGMTIGTIIGTNVSKYLGRYITDSLGIRTVTTAEKMSVYSEKMNAEIQKMLERGSFVRDLYSFVGRSKKRYWDNQIIVDRVPKNTNYKWGAPADVINKFEERMSEQIMKYADMTIQGIQTKRNLKAYDIEAKITNLGGFYLGLLGTGYATGARVKKKPSKKKKSK